ncbi:hypothetical protein GCM10010924_47130 [Rhizobium wenxiniae]|nr:hypothetical protein GCM10010924_47130 [Rhizobium wenxiniae]
MDDNPGEQCEPDAKLCGPRNVFACTCSRDNDKYGKIQDRDRGIEVCYGIESEDQSGKNYGSDEK